MFSAPIPHTYLLVDELFSSLSPKKYIFAGHLKLYSVVPKVLGYIAPQAYPIPLAMKVSPSEKKRQCSFLQFSLLLS